MLLLFSVKSVGDIIGSGAFSEVREYYCPITDFDIEDNVQDDTEKGDTFTCRPSSKLKTAHSRRSSLASRRSSLASQLSSTGENTFAMKTLKYDLSRSTKISGLVDLTIEAHFLARLSHPNIVNLLSTGGEPGSTSFFIVIERVSCTLAEVIKKCRFQRRRMKSIGVNKYGEKMDKVQTKIELRYEFNNRINILRQIASAVRYLHSHS
jgi:serine/threonine protein kinase